eukprot:9074456-Pyramimonas_sp.AAC.1
MWRPARSWYPACGHRHRWECQRERKRHLLEHRVDSTDGADRALRYVAQMSRGRTNPMWGEGNITSFYGSSCANNGKDALNTPETRGDTQ